MKDNFTKSLEHVLVHEGGYVDHPSDPGGPTNKGITLRVFQRTYGKDKTKEDLKVITDDHVSHIYYTVYWQACRFDDLPEGIDYVVFDQRGQFRTGKVGQVASGYCRRHGRRSDRTSVRCSYEVRRG